MLYCKKHFLKIKRPFTVPQAMIANPQLTWTLHKKEEENEEQEVNSPIKFKKEDQSRELSMENYLSLKIGQAKVPLAYVTRKSVTLPEDVPNNGEPDPGFNQCDTLEEEMIRRTRHDNANFATDDEAVWDVPREAIHGGPAWPWIKCHNRSKDGGAAHIDLKDH